MGRAGDTEIACHRVTPLDWNTFVIITSVAGFSAGGAWWLSREFSKVRKMIHEEMKSHRLEDDRQFSDHLERIMRLEYKTEGRTYSGRVKP